MIDFSSRDTLPKDDFGRIAIPHTIIDSAEPANMGTLLNSGLALNAHLDNDYNNLINHLRSDYYECCTFLLENRQYARYGDDPGDYQNAAADLACMLQTTFDMALWHSELNTQMIYELNLWLNCADEDHCIHQFAVDGPNLWLDRVAVDWESCPINNPIGL
jgi:hypothetical protein